MCSNARCGRYTAVTSLAWVFRSKCEAYRPLERSGLILRLNISGVPTRGVSNQPIVRGRGAAGNGESKTLRFRAPPRIEAAECRRCACELHHGGRDEAFPAHSSRHETEAKSAAVSVFLFFSAFAHWPARSLLSGQCARGDWIFPNFALVSCDRGCTVVLPSDRWDVFSTSLDVNSAYVRKLLQGRRTAAAVAATALGGCGRRSRQSKRRV